MSCYQAFGFRTLLVIFMLVIFVSGQLTRNGPCPDVALQKDFNPNKYFNGLYYQLGKIENFLEEDLRCNQAHNSIANGDVTVINSGIDIKTGAVERAVGEGFCSSDEPAKCFVRFDDEGRFGNYWVIDSDPKKFGLVYSCVEFVQGKDKVHKLFAWILSRTPRSIHYRYYRNQLTSALGISKGSIKRTNRRGCDKRRYWGQW